MKKVLSTILIVLYAIVAITVTVLLLSYNEYRISELGGYTFYIVSDDSLEPEYEKGSLLVIEGTTGKKLEAGDEVFLYVTNSDGEAIVMTDTVVNKAMSGDFITLELEQIGQLDSSYLIGAVNDTKVYPTLGTILGILESKWGYLFLVVIVSLLLFLQEVFELYMELKYGNDGEAQAQDAQKSAKTVKAEKIETVEEKVEKEPVAQAANENQQTKEN